MPSDAEARVAANVEEARKVAFNAFLDGMHFHEVAIRNPFEAERQYQALARKITQLLGEPEGVRVVGTD